MMEIASNLYKISEVELIYKSKFKASERPQIGCSRDAYEILLQCWDENKIDFIEQFKILLLNQASKVIGISDISSGGLTGTVADTRVIFATALKANACKIIMAHNHPSGNLQPSNADQEMTCKVMEAGNYLDVKVLDHLIVTREGYYSFADKSSSILYPTTTPF